MPGGKGAGGLLPAAASDDGAGEVAASTRTVDDSTLDWRTARESSGATFVGASRVADGASCAPEGSSRVPVGASRVPESEAATAGAGDTDTLATVGKGECPGLV